MSRDFDNSPWLVVAAGFHHSGGMDKANLALVQYLVEQQIPVHVVAHSVDSELSKLPLVTVHRVHAPRGMLFLGEPLLDWKGRKVARRLLHQWPNANIVVNGGNCLWPGINWVHYVHHGWRPPTNEGPVWHRIKTALFDYWCRKREREAFQKARFIITNAHSTSRHVREAAQVEERKVRTIYLGSDPQWGPPTERERAIAREALKIPPSRAIAVFVGALGLDHRKGFDVLFEAWRELCADPEWDVDLVAAGTGRAFRMWQEKVVQHGLRNRIRLLGFSTHVKDLLAAADVLVSPVRYEPYGLNVQEAICRGVPALVSSSAGVAEKYGDQLLPMLLPDPENVADLMRRLQGWRLRMDYWKSQFRALSEELREQTWMKMAEQIVSLVQQEPKSITKAIDAHASRELIGHKR